MSISPYCIIMAGGVGSRFWPQSRQSKPKQFLDILGTGKSFLRTTYERFLPIIPNSHFLVVTNSRYKNLVLEQLPELREDQILCEPIGRNTAPCIAYAAYSIASIDPSAKMIITPSDHFITGDELFGETIQEALDFIEEHDALMTIGIKPSRPETGYGYIQVADRGSSISRVKCFTEKPDLQLATTFVECGEFVWNSGLFIWSVKSIIEAYKTYLPECHNLFSSISAHYHTDAEEEAINRVFSECKSISVDYAIMEKAENVYVKIGEFAWSDVGTWGALFGHAKLDENGNITPSTSYLHNTSETVISSTSNKLIVVSGLKEYIVVDTDDVLMICPRCEEQSIKNFTEDIKYKIGDSYL